MDEENANENKCNKWRYSNSESIYGPSFRHPLYSVRFHFHRENTFYPKNNHQNWLHRGDQIFFPVVVLEISQSHHSREIAVSRIKVESN